MNLFDKSRSLENSQHQPNSGPLNSGPLNSGPLNSIIQCLGQRRRTMPHLNIAQKISYGFACSICIAVLGVGAGLMVGDAHQR
ncbi:MAG: hypothetical protein F6K30_30220, partial [Cyanothece sp. SIO2G6]|nr:hypothetical protein [Cyanothece sp. SIO2G6]